MTSLVVYQQPVGADVSTALSFSVPCDSTATFTFAGNVDTSVGGVSGTFGLQLFYYNVALPGTRYYVGFYPIATVTDTAIVPITAVQTANLSRGTYVVGLKAQNQDATSKNLSIKGTLAYTVVKRYA